MCKYYLNLHACTHETYALAKHCSLGAMIQTPCKKRDVWQKVECEECEGCRVPDHRRVDHGRVDHGRVGVDQGLRGVLEKERREKEVVRREGQRGVLEKGGKERDGRKVGVRRVVGKGRGRRG
ncbi:hypothetical protein HYFRA_00005183 [Hymenoscyphus fraxineus]|uniref:Uncharacterized protein n=1 Tax=Hymenoscyphus fraxineus TaxID=746836 RepID=A0A9N9KLR1_9HELO|nr:hypothetical protein HYFRA_00014234 [Hymenoscyphus fraxineus]CAG8962139.1 hypothetical protein HYFRA_00005183 [Hymenoscyphus fraxineus]